jgi:hypothetical protein
MCWPSRELKTANSEKFSYRNVAYELVLQRPIEANPFIRTYPFLDVFRVWKYPA